MAEILDNQEVTTDTLNNIAIDLGATSFNGFTTNKFGTDELNNITKAIVGKGILQNGNKCNPYKVSDNLYINTGTIVFASGAKIRITTAILVGEVTNAYIYALNDTTKNTAYIKTTETKPTTGDYVMLAQITSDGALKDAREWAVSNVLLAAPTTLTKSLTVTQSPQSQTYELDTEWEGWTRIIYHSANGYVETPNMTMIPTSESQDMKWVYSGSFGSSSNAHYSDLAIVRNGTKITLAGYFKTASTGYTFEFKFI